MRRSLIPAAVLTAFMAGGSIVSSHASVPGSMDGAAPRPAAGETRLPDEVHVEVTDWRFTPATVVLARGGTIVFDHLGPSHHSATDATGMLLYDSGVVDETSPPTSYRFEAAGVYPFVCTPHPFMGGRVSVPVRATPLTGSLKRVRTITWATDQASDGFVYDVQIRRPGTGWISLRKGTAVPSASFRPDAGRGTYRFRARLRGSGTAASRWSEPASIHVG